MGYNKTEKKYFDQYKDHTFINPEDLSLNKWLDLMNHNKDKKILFIDSFFPSKVIREEYLETINHRTNKDVINLIRRFLIASGTYTTDLVKREHLFEIMNTDKDYFDRLMEVEFNKRLLRSVVKNNTGAWEGNTWVIDLLYRHPQLALDVLHAYLAAHIGFMPDAMINGLSDAISLIRSKFINTPKSDYLYSINPYEFEHLINSLYMTIGYTTKITRKSHDKGIDIICDKEEVGSKEIILVQCKTSKNRIGVNILRELLGVVTDQKVNRGVLVTNSTFTNEASNFRDENPRINLIDNHNLQKLLNTHFGSKWFLHVDAHISRSMINEKANNNANKRSLQARAFS